MTGFIVFIVLLAAWAWLVRGNDVVAGRGGIYEQ